MSSNTKAITINDTGNNFPDDATADAVYDGVTDTIRACQTIMATSDIMNGSDISFVAGESITLMNGFSTENSTFVARIETCSNINEPIIEQRQENLEQVTTLKIYPNPTRDELFLAFNHLSVVNSIRLYDQLGHEIRYWREDARSLSLLGLEKGMYIIVVETAEQIYTRKIIKQ
ncbi:MAG: T9SS type A sorting domain-containing protein [Bacteroidota bacterium]